MSKSHNLFGSAVRPAPAANEPNYQAPSAAVVLGMPRPNTMNGSNN